MVAALATISILIHKSPLTVLLIAPPLSLYIHLPWCIRKCPYCDFNSHTGFTQDLEADYIHALLADLNTDLPRLQGRKPQTIFLGGGTPSLFSAKALNQLLQAIARLFDLSLDDVEITLEANPGTFEQAKFADFRAIGINRLSVGVQSFQDNRLTTLGRIHNGSTAYHALEQAQQAGFTDINVDLMYGLSEQTVAEAMNDLTTALKTQPTHLSWYQLTLEPNTVFYKRPPPLPHEDHLLAIEEHGKALLADHGFHPYEISAYTQSHPCQHNLNYWLFGDYLGIGAGSHSKITDLDQQQINRWHKRKQPKEYLSRDKPFIAQQQTITTEQLSFEFMLNALRLYQPIPFALFESRTGLTHHQLQAPLTLARQKSLVQFDATQLTVTPLGHRYLNNLIELFL